MLKATEEEIEGVREYFEWQAPDLKVIFLQKVYSEVVLNTAHDVWDVHTDKDRWWVITGGTNLYSQEQFPNMDLALTFHIGLLLRVPRSEKQQQGDHRLRAFTNVFEKLEDVDAAVSQAHNLADFQAVGVRSRETLLELIAVAQDSAIWTDSPPQRANFRAWTEILGNELMPGDSNKERRGAFKTSLESAWTFSNWLTHSKSAAWIDADLAQSLLQQAIGIATSFLLRGLRGVPDACPNCGSSELEPEEGENTSVPDVLFERPRCRECGWAGRPVPVVDLKNGQSIITRFGEKSHDHSIMTIPFRTIHKPGDPAIEPLTGEEPGPPEPTVYFAYGSNMSTARLKKRMPSCQPMGIATLPRHVLRFHKRSTDKSGKCNAFATDDDREVIGVLFSFDPKDRPKLDEAEGAGKGYNAATVTVINEAGRRRKVLTYLATADYIDDALKPYTWYKEHVLAGSKEHRLPAEYVSTFIEPVVAIEDLNTARAKREWTRSEDTAREG